MRPLFAALCLFATPAVAQDAPRVVADIAPINAIITQIMKGVGTPSQIIPTGASPHGYAMRPSEARALGDADLVVWVGPALTHWLEEPLDSLSGDAVRLTLMEGSGAMTLPMRAATKLGKADDHGHGHDDHDHGGHEDHGDKEASHDDHGHEEKGHGDHDRDHDHDAQEHDDHGHAGHNHVGNIDPHGWLSPSNAVLWASQVNEALSEIDPANSDTYTANFEAFRAEANALEAEIKAQLSPFRETPFIVLHDAFHYFEASFDIEADAFIIPSGGSTPGPAQVKALRDFLAENPATCAFVSPQENEGLLNTVIAGQGTRIAALDPLGDGMTPYATMIRQFADSMAGCFSQG